MPPKRCTMDPLTAFDILEKLRHRISDEAAESKCRGRKRRLSRVAVALDIVLTIAEGTRDAGSAIDQAQEAWRAER